MAFDQSQDKELLVIGEVNTKDKETCKVSIRKYKDGDPKIDVTRHGIGWNDREYHKGMGRLSWEEAQQIVPLINEALEKLEGI